MATIKEVAREAGVSVGTVSNVLRGASTVNTKIRERVNKVIRLLDYHPSHAARSLKTSRTHLLGMVISDITNPFFPQLARGAEDAAIEHGYLVIASNTDDQLEREKRVLAVLRSRRVDGILLVVAPNGGDMEHIRRVIASKIPVVCLDRVPEGLSVSAVTTDAITSSEMCMRHLISMGHCRIAIINGNPELQTARDRLQGYRNVLTEAGIAIEPELILTGDFRANSGYLLAKQLLLGGLNPTALYVTNGMMALGALRAVKELGLRCPGDLALAVFDEVPGNGSFSPEVTSVIQPAYQIGYQGVELLLRQVESGEPSTPIQIRLPAELRIGESTQLRRAEPRASLLIVAMLVAMLAAIQPLKADSLAEALREQRYDAALQFADAALKNRPGDVFLMTARGLALGGMKRTRESLEAFEAVLQSNPEFVPALKGAAQVSYTARDPRAPSFLKRLIGLDPTDATARSMAGVLAFEAGDYPSAAAQFEAGHAETESNPQAYAIYGACLVKLHRAKEAVVVFERLHWKNPESTTILRSLASAQAAAGTPEVAAATLKRALEAGPGEEQTYVDLAALYILNDAGDLALAAIQAGLEKLPRSARLYSLRGVVEAGNGMEADAEGDFAISTRLDPDGQYGSAGLGVLYADTGRAAEASKILRGRLQKSPSDATLNYLLAQALVREGATPGTPIFREAEAALLTATRIRSDYAAAHTALGKLYAQSGDDARAIAEFQVALSLNASDRAALNQLAGLLRRAGRIGEATELTRRLRQLVISEAESVPSR